MPIGHMFPFNGKWVEKKKKKKARIITKPITDFNLCLSRHKKVDLIKASEF